MGLRVLAIDPGVNLGFAWEGGSGEVRLAQRGRTPLERHQSLFKALAKWLADKLYEVRPDVLVIEAPFMSAARPQAAAVLYGMRAVIVSVATDCDVVEVPPTQWQAWSRKHGYSKSKSVGGHAQDASYLRKYYLEG